MNKKIVITSLILLIGVVYLFVYSTDNHNIEREINAVKAENAAITETLELKMDKWLQDYGVEDTLSIVKNIFSEGLMSADDCHTVLHTAGHLAYQYYPENLDLLANQDSGLCIGSFYHGVEAQISFSLDFKEPLISYCAELQKEFPGINCYHGAGHGFMEVNQSLSRSLKACDSLKSDIQQDVTNCYRGVFSEYGARALGYSGDTGKPIPITVHLDYENPYEPCQDLDEQYKNSCYTQLSKIIATNNDTNTAMQKCLNNDFTNKIQKICIEIASAIAARIALSGSETVATPPTFHLLSPELQESYFIGLKDSFLGFNNDKSYRDWRKTCDQFDSEKEAINCVAVFENPEKTSTW